jgi:post-segregation antitoxin (ccd killing protein)
MNDQTPIRRSLVDKFRDAQADPVARVERMRQWKAENADAVASYNAWFEEHGILVGPFRKP